MADQARDEYNPTDEELVRACNAGDARAFEVLYHRYKDWAVRVAYRFTGEREASLDVMQEAFMHLLTRFPGFVLNARLTSYLYVVIKHGALSRKRRDKRWGSGRAADEPSGGEISGGGEADTASALTKAMEGLSEGHREVLLMRVVDEMSMQEIATALSVPVGTVKSRLHHALAALRENPATRAYFEGADGDGKGTI